MKKVTGLGGIFFKTADTAETRKWYTKHLGIDAGEYGANFRWRPAEGSDDIAITVWSPFKNDTRYFEPGDQEFMINYRVEDLGSLIKTLVSEGVRQIGEIEEYPYGKFAWIIDCDGRKVELWEPVDKELEGE